MPHEKGQTGPVGSMAVDLRKLADAIEYIEAVNRLPLNEITWTRDNVCVPVTAHQIDDWRFTGLNNRDFAREYLLPNSVVSHTGALPDAKISNQVPSPGVGL